MEKCVAQIEEMRVDRDFLAQKGPYTGRDRARKTVFY
jgi:hypothetical protein